MTHEVSLALVGNPNCGKTSLFNELTGSNHSVGNWPGVTVERKTGIIKGTDNIVLQDLPGIYSMSPYSPEEVVARDYLIQDIPDAVLNIVDASNLERNLYLTLQLLETGHPVIVVLNMMDVVKKQGTLLNDNQLGYLLGVQTIPISVTKNQGLQELTHIISKRRSGFSPIVNYPTYDDRLEVALDEISQLIEPYVSAYQLRWYSIKLFEKDTQVMEVLELPPDIQQEIAEIITISEKVFDDDSESIIVNARYEFIDDVTAMCLQHSPTATQTMSDKIDRVVTNKWLALPIFAIVMWFVYYLAIQTVGALGTDWVNERLFGEYIPHITSYWLATWQVAPWLQSLILDGILAGVGAVLGFVPQLMVLFLCLSFLEDCGYMSRIAFVMDRLFRRFGLSGKSFIPMLVATGCGVPGIMASRTIENEKDRRMTIMTTTFMPCSAKLPIIGLISGAFFHAARGLLRLPIFLVLVQLYYQEFF
ncbi:ferrous iron transport protein B [Vagococcus penaei]|uniref:Ferrous iron transport protein B n=1 Tax=Vagococcus penaei TaxID=633807 RepID=A0A1Q2D7K9_9ENTE|nr:ferrous iron transport protein B [Vagococcus penaei]